MELVRLDDYRCVIPRHGKMLVDAKLFISENLFTEDTALEQLCDAASLFSVKHAIGMPDIHQGYGVPIGSVVALEGAIAPAAVGYDINCGMRLILTPLDYDDVKDKLTLLAKTLRRFIPLGEGKRNIRLPKAKFNSILEGGLKAYLKTDTGNADLEDFRREDEERADMERVEDKGSMKGDVRAVSQKAYERGHTQLGTLGGGNHFIEVQRVQKVFDEKLAQRFGLRKNQITVMIHSGSRGFGHQVGGEYMKLARKLNAKRSPNNYLCFLESDTEEGRRYIGAMHAAANFAFANRQIMCAFVRGVLRTIFGEMELPILYDVPHNIAKYEVHGERGMWVHRKGATRAFPPSRMKQTQWSDVGQPVLIPGSMGTASYVLVGTEESSESLHSVNHGAGRVMSRTAARGRYRKSGKKRSKPALISDEEFWEAMKHIVLVCEDRRAIKEEAPQAYKDIDAVIEVVTGAGLAKAVARLVPLAVLKG